MKKFLHSLSILVFVAIFSLSNAQTDTSKVQKTNTNKPVIYGVLLSGMYYNFTDLKPQKGFEMRMALLGVNYQMNEKFSTVMMLDFGRTTRDIVTKDSLGKPLTMSYTEGSAYTAFLKEAKFIYTVSKNFEISAGMLVTDQYVINRKFWEREYVVRTFQEEYYYGHPADFGVKLKVGVIKDKLNLHFTLLNGDGPYKRQQANGDLQYTAMIESYPFKNTIFTLYGDYINQGDNGSKYEKTAFAGLLGYKSSKFMLGAEFNLVKNPVYMHPYLVKNPNFINDTHQGYSFFGSYKFAEKWGIFGRYDYIEKSPLGTVKQNFWVAGLEYIYDKYRASLNYRNAIPNDRPQLWISFYAKFI